MYQKGASSKALANIDTINHMTKPRIFQVSDDCNSMPWDEGIDEVASNASLAGSVYKCLSDIRPSDTWRRIGQARRKFLLEEDKRKGGTSFDLNINCKVDRYFEVAHRVGDEIHKFSKL